MERYELVYIINGDVTDDHISDVTKRIEDHIKKTIRDSSIVKKEYMGRRRLAYPVKKKTSGTYVVVIFTGEPGGIGKLKRELALDDALLRHMVVRREEKSEAQLAKEQSLREKIELSRARKSEAERTAEDTAPDRQKLVQEPSELKKRKESTPETLEKLEEQLDEILKRDIVE